jgi:uncharacterized protein YjbI with pentapeptide repeats
MTCCVVNLPHFLRYGLAKFIANLSGLQSARAGLGVLRMAEISGALPDEETPVNPYSLLEAVNRSSDTAHASWLIFLAIMTYFMIAVAGVTHRDLLLETPVSLPMLQVDIQLTQFFQFAPIILVLLHLGLISQLTLLARKALELDRAIGLLESNDRRQHPLRLELNNFFFVQALAGPQRSSTMGMFLHGMSWLTLVILPVVLILYIQVVFLPYHDVGITWTHRIALVADLAALMLIGVFLFRAETSFFQAFFRTTTAHPISFLTTVSLLSIVALFSFFIATIPGEALDRITQTVTRPFMKEGDRSSARLAAGFSLPFLSATSDGALFGIFRRNLHVTDTDLVVDKEQTKGEPSFSLRGRDLRFATLDRSDLHQVDMTSANLDGASFVGTDLSDARLNCADANAVFVENDRAKAKCSTARNANFSRAKLQGADLLGIDLTGATFADASLEGAVLSYAILMGADFLNAQLDKADLTGGIKAYGVSFLLADLSGADLSWGNLAYADLSNAQLRGTVLKSANLQSASLRDSDLRSGSLQGANLYGADLTGLQITGADMRSANVWMTKPPASDAQGLADFSSLALKPMPESDKEAMREQIKAIKDDVLRKRLQEAVAPLLNDSKTGSWATSSEYGGWAQLLEVSPTPDSEIYPGQLTAYLSDVMCRARYSDGALATGVARRASDAEFRGDRVLIHDRLRANNCPASRSVLDSVWKEFTTISDASRSN